MSKLDISHETPDRTIAWEVELFFDDGDNPNAGEETVGYFTDEQEALAAMRTALANKPGDVPSTVEPGNTAGWSGVAEHGVFVRDPDDEWFVPPTFERDGYQIVEYRGS